MRPLLITDLDNTIYNWVDYYAASFRGMLHALSRTMKVPEQELIEDFRNVFKQHGTVEYSFSIQELDHCNGLNQKEIEELVRIGKGAFKIVRDANLKPYSDVVQTLQWANLNKVLVVGVTNAPVFHGKMRLKQLHLDKYFWGLAGWEGNDVPDDSYTKDIREKRDSDGYKTHISKFWFLHREELKPSPLGYLRVINDVKTSHKVTYIIGDSLTKDIQPALQIGAVGIWAEYGMHFDKKNFETLLKITHWDNDKVREAYNNDIILPNYTINNYSELMDIIIPQQISLF